jgi:hypothetical protein
MILLAGVLIILSEKILFDANKHFNPAGSSSGYVNCKSNQANCYGGQKYVPYTADKYETYRLLIHAAITLPILLGAILLYILYERKTTSGGHIASWAFFGVAFWLCLRLLIEMMYFLIKKYESLGIYIVLLVFAAVLTWLVVALQRRHMLKKGINQ